MRFAIIAALVLLAGPALGDSRKEAINEKLRLMECRGEMVTTILNGTRLEREMVAVFLESRRLGRIESFDRQWCIDKGILPTKVLPGMRDKDKPT